MERRKKRRELSRCNRFNMHSGSTQMIVKNQLQILIEKRNDLSQWNNNNQLLGDDNIIMIRANDICLIFDWDFDSYLIDHALPIKTNSNPVQATDQSMKFDQDSDLENNQNSLQVFYEKTGIIKEDITNLIKLTVHLELKDI